jgi:hypothetical protein
MTPKELEAHRSKATERKRRQLADPAKRRAVKWRKGAPVEGRGRWNLAAERAFWRKLEAVQASRTAYEDWFDSLDGEALEA